VQDFPASDARRRQTPHRARQDGDHLSRTTTSERNPVHKAFQILSWMASSPIEELGVRQIAGGVGLSAGTTHRLLTLLEANGVVSRTTGGKYRLGLEIMRIGWAVTERFSIVQAARPHVEELVRECNETVCLGLYDRTRYEMMFALVVDADRPLRYVVQQHEWIPVYAGASGLGILAFLPGAERAAILEHVALKPLTDQTILDPELIEQEAVRVRERGYAISKNQRVEGAIGIAAPIWGRPDGVVGDVLITIPRQRFRPESEALLAAKATATAAKITAELGATADR
jgi:IclR family acetate operon transcriptional repressor